MLTYSSHFKLFEISLMLTGARLSDLKSVLLHRAAADVPLCSFSGQARAHSNFAFLQIYSGIDTKLSAKTPVKPGWDWHTGLWQEPFIGIYT